MTSGHSRCWSCCLTCRASSRTSSRPTSALPSSGSLRSRRYLAARALHTVVSCSPTGDSSSPPSWPIRNCCTLWWLDCICPRRRGCSPMALWPPRLSSPVQPRHQFPVHEVAHALHAAGLTGPVLTCPLSLSRAFLSSSLPTAAKRRSRASSTSSTNACRPGSIPSW